MCGINGIIHYTNNNQDQLAKALHQMNNLIIHRGPDDDGAYINSTPKGSIAMGMRRLSIIDLSTGDQPMYNADRSITLVFNGEIYNFLSLKEKLQNQGVAFDTQSDTEVILKLYETYGTQSFAMLDGMFAFSIHDSKQNKVFIARDYFGEKPLYYTQYKDQFIWASELKSVVSLMSSVPPIYKPALNLYFALTYIPAPFSIYEGVHKLEANHYLEIDLDQPELKIHEIEQDFQNYQVDSKPKATALTHDLVYKSVESRSVSDVPIGTFLSGGVDSSIVSLCLAQQKSQKINTFSIGFETKSYDETEKSREVAKIIQSDHNEIIITEKDIAKDIDAILQNFDEPFADSSALPSYVVANKTSQQVKVALTGDGGDEIFGGYTKYYMGKLNQKYTAFMPKAIHQLALKSTDGILAPSKTSNDWRTKFRKLLKAIDYHGEYYYNIISLGYTPDEFEKYIQQHWIQPNPLAYYKEKYNQPVETLTDFRNIDRLISLEGDMLVKVDRTSMLNSLECRAPFLNKELWNFTSQVPEKYLLKGWDKKHLLKEAYKSYFPEGFLDKKKKGFGVPVGQWLRSDLKKELLSYCEQAFIEKQALFNYEAISKLVHQHIDGKVDNAFRVWTFYCFQKWYKKNYMN